MRGGIALAAVLACTGCDRNRVDRAEANDSVDAGTSWEAIDSGATNPQVSPCADFYAYACGGFEERAVLAPDEGAVWRAFTPVRARNDALVRDILRAWESHAGARDATEDLVGDFYAACNDLDAIDAAGDSELRSLLDSVRTTSPAEVAHAVALVHALGGDALFSFTPEIDPIDGVSWVALLRQPELDLPFEDFRDGKETARLYARIARTFELAGDDRDRAEREATDAIAIESSLAVATEPRSVFRDPKHAVLLVGAGNVAALQRRFDWDAYYTTVGMSPPIFVHVVTPAYLSSAAFTSALASPGLASFLRWEILRVLAPALSRDFRNAAFEYEKARTGVVAEAPRSETCAHLAEDFFGGAIDRPFAEAATDHERLERASSVAGELMDALRARLEARDVSPEAKSRALAKAKALHIEIGAGDRIVDLPKAPIDRQHFLRDFVLISSWRKTLSLGRIGKVKGVHDWRLAATAANAELDVRIDRIEIAAGLLAPPFAGSRSDAAELGTLGVVVGHELAHAFDGVGWRYDERGNFDPRAALDIASAPFAIAPALAPELQDVTVNGAPLHVPRIVDETAADVTGLALAHDALAARPLPKDAAKERERAFFTAYAQLWCARFRPEELAEYVKHDAHPPPRSRVDEAVSHQAAFAAAFDCQAGPMVRSALP